VSLTSLAALAVLLVGTACARGLNSWRRAARRIDAWMAAARPATLAGTTIPSFAIDSDVPIMALVGVLRPRLLITQPVMDALTNEELRASVAHELGHWRAWDNLKRLLMQTAPDLLPATRWARAIERRWAAASELVADRAAGNTGAERCALASALVKVARMTPPVTPALAPISTLVDEGDITSRVHRLLDETAGPRGGRSTRWLIAIPAVALALGYSPLLQLVHEVTEILVRTMP
jgi:Zn-dependent protease with chaperone function